MSSPGPNIICDDSLAGNWGVNDRFDAVIGNPPGHCGLLRDKVMDDPARLKASVRKLLDLEFDTLLFGDGVSILRDAKVRLKDLVATFPGV